MAPEKNNSVYKNYNDDEIDLGDLLFGILAVLRANFKLIIVFVFIGLLVSTFLYINADRTYKSGMILSTGMLSVENGGSLIKTMDQLIQQGNDKQIARLLELPHETIEKLISMTVATETQENVGELRANIFKIEVTVLDNDILPLLENGIINYLEKNPYVRKRIEIKKGNLEALIKHVHQERLEIDSVRQNLTGSMVAKGDGLNVIMIDPANMYAGSIAMFEKELELRRELMLIDNIQVIEGFTVFEKPVTPLFRLLLAGPVIGLLLAVLIIMIKEINKYMKKKEQGTPAPA